MAHSLVDSGGWVRDPMMKEKEAEDLNVSSTTINRTVVLAGASTIEVTDMTIGTEIRGVAEIEAENMIVAGIETATREGTGTEAVTEEEGTWILEEIET